MQALNPSNDFALVGIQASPPPKAQDQVEGGLLLDVVVRKSAAVLELLASEDQPLLVRWDPFLVLDLGLDVLNGVRWFNFQSDGLAGQRLDENLHGGVFFVCRGGLVCWVGGVA